MSLRFAESGGQYHAGNVTGPGIWGSAVAGIASNLLARNGSTWGYGQNSAMFTPLLTGTGFSGMIAGLAYNIGSAYSNPTGVPIIAFYDNNNNSMCDLRFNASGQLYFTRNGTNLGPGAPSLSTGTVALSSWHYIEFKALFATTATGTCEVYVDGVLFLTLTSVQNATVVALGYVVHYQAVNNATSGMMDFYVLDTVSGVDTTYLGDVTVAEVYPNAPGVNSAWAVNQAAFALTGTGTLTAGTSLVYNGTITNGASPTNAWQGFYFTVSGFANTHNNGTWLCIASTATTITLANTDTLATGGVTGATATCAFQNPVQAGIHGGTVDGYATTNLGTRPPGDNQYISDATANDITDYAHQTLTLTGNIAGVVHVTLARKDDAGVRQMAQVCLSTGTTSTSANITLSTTYQYYSQVLEADPHTSAAWLLAAFNAATFGVKEIT